MTNNCTVPILGVFQKLLSLRSTELQAFDLLNSLVANLTTYVVARGLPTRLRLADTLRLRSQRTTVAVLGRAVQGHHQAPAEQQHRQVHAGVR